MDSIEWMAWIPGTAMFIAGVVVAMVLMVVVALKWPSTTRRGWLQIDTARGDRIYICLLGTGLIMILYVAFTDLPLPYGLLIAAVIWIAPVLRWG